MFIEICAASHAGRVRRGNEDDYLLLNISSREMLTGSENACELGIECRKFEIDDTGAVLAVADGVGGLLAGAAASRMAVEIVCQKILEESRNDSESSDTAARLSLVEKLYDATVCANQSIIQKGLGDQRLIGMAATFTGVCIAPNTIGLIQVGDSRGYLIRGGKIYQATKDQSLVQQLLDARQISPEQARTHRLKNVILQALGAQKDVRPVVSRLLPQRADILLLCSDGLSNKLPADVLLKIVNENRNDLKTACAFLTHEANERGGEDNITVILARLSGGDLPEASEEAIKIGTPGFGGVSNDAPRNAADKFYNRRGFRFGGISLRTNFS